MGSSLARDRYKEMGDNPLLSLFRNPVVLLVLGLIVGLVVGLLYAWVINPVQYTDAWAHNLDDNSKQFYLQSVTQEWLVTRDANHAWERLAGGIKGDAHIGELLDFVKAKMGGDGNVTAMLIAVQDAEQAAGGPPQAGPGLATYVGACLALLVVVAVIGGAGWYFYTRRGAAAGGAAGMAGGGAAGAVAEAPVAEWGRATPPVAQFTSKYRPTDVGYDDSFSIDTPAGDFLGECGVGLSETVGTGDPKKITALEVWLFDKNDIRTVTKVLMSEHAYYDDALRAKLAPKGEAILGQVGETVLLETQTLQVSARVVELEYGAAQGGLPQNSYFSKVTIELAAWPKEAVPATTPA
jgi:hypothetical protein